jgi:hypothetical protein
MQSMKLPSFLRGKGDKSWTTNTPKVGSKPATSGDVLRNVSIATPVSQPGVYYDWLHMFLYIEIAKQKLLKAISKVNSVLIVLCKLNIFSGPDNW